MSVSAFFNPATWNLAVQAFQRNNPILEMVARFQQLVYMIKNYNSNVKLNKFRHNLYMQQLHRMERFLSESSPYRVERGKKIDRRF